VLASIDRWPLVQAACAMYTFVFPKWSVAPASASDDAHSDLLRSLNIQSIIITNQLRLKHVSTNEIVKATSDYPFYNCVSVGLIIQTRLSSCHPLEIQLVIEP
jgi:hypothetical protein